MDIKKDHKGILLSCNLFSHTVYIIFTKAGCDRGGKRRDKKKSWVMFFGEVESVTKTNDQKETELVRRGFRHVPENIPHLLRFKRHSFVIEWWHKSAVATKDEDLCKMKT